MNNINSISKYEENAQNSEINRFQSCEDIVEDIIEQDILSSNLPVNVLVNKVAQNYGISSKEARTCLNLALKQTSANEKSEEKQQEECYSNCGYYYPAASKPTSDGMANLNSFGIYNRMMFGIK